MGFTKNTRSWSDLRTYSILPPRYQSPNKSRRRSGKRCRGNVRGDRALGTRTRRNPWLTRGKHRKCKYPVTLHLLQPANCMNVPQLSTVMLFCPINPVLSISYCPFDSILRVNYGNRKGSSRFWINNIWIQNKVLSIFKQWTEDNH